MTTDVEESAEPFTEESPVGEQAGEEAAAAEAPAEGPRQRRLLRSRRRKSPRRRSKRQPEVDAGGRRSGSGARSNQAPEPGSPLAMTGALVKLSSAGSSS
jgi:hypothetical protein